MTTIERTRIADLAVQRKWIKPDSPIRDMILAGKFRDIQDVADEVFADFYHSDEGYADFDDL